MDASTFYGLFEVLAGDVAACERVGAPEASTHEHYDALPGLRVCAGEWTAKRSLRPHADFPGVSGDTLRVAYSEERILGVCALRAHVP